MPKKKYSINSENDETTSFEVDGVTYNSLDDVPNEKDRNKLAAMMQASEDEEDFPEVKFDDKEFADLRRMAASNTMEKTVLGIFTGVAVLMILITVITSFFNFQKMGKEKSAPGVVVDITATRVFANIDDHTGRDFYSPVVEFTAADGKKRQVKMSEGSDTQYYEKGNEVTVLYNPAHPLDARIKSAGSSALMWILPAITGILGIAFAGGVFVVKKVLFNDEQQTNQSPQDIG